VDSISRQSRIRSSDRLIIIKPQSSKLQTNNHRPGRSSAHCVGPSHGVFPNFDRKLTLLLGLSRSSSASPFRADVSPSSESRSVAGGQGVCHGENTSSPEPAAAVEYGIYPALATSEKSAARASEEKSVHILTLVSGKCFMATKGKTDHQVPASSHIFPPPLAPVSLVANPCGLFAVAAWIASRTGCETSSETRWAWFLRTRAARTSRLLR
jgi:hypothetical protein